MERVRATERRWATCGGLILVLAVGAAIVVLPLAYIRSHPSDPDACLQPVENLSAFRFSSHSLPSLEVVPVELETTYREDDWLCWHSDPFPIRTLVLEREENTLWLAMDPIQENGLVRWNLEMLEAERIHLSGISGVMGVAVTGPAQLVAPGSEGIALYDHGQVTTTASSPGVVFPFNGSGVDRGGTVWLQSVQSGNWHRCSGRGSDWACKSFVHSPEPVGDYLWRCRLDLWPPDPEGLWNCVTRPRRTTHTSIDPPTPDQWRFFSGAECGVTWDRDCAGQMVVLSQNPHRIERTLPWPNVDVDHIRWVTANERQVWFFAYGQQALWLHEAGEWRRFEWPYWQPTALVADPVGGVWASVPDFGLVFVSPEAMHLYQPRDRLYAIPIDRGYEVPRWMRPGLGLAVTSLAETTDGRVWAGTDGGGLWVFDENERVWLPTDINQSFVNTLLADPKGGLWVGTRLGGVTHYDGPGNRKWWRIPDGLPVDVVIDLAYDDRGRLWAGTRDGQLSLFDGQRWQVMTENSDVEASPIEPAYEWPWFRHHRVGELSVPVPRSFEHYIHALQDSRGRVWVAGREGVCLRDVTPTVPGNEG